MCSRIFQKAPITGPFKWLEKVEIVEKQLEAIRRGFFLSNKTNVAKNLKQIEEELCATLFVIGFLSLGYLGNKGEICSTDFHVISFVNAQANTFLQTKTEQRVCTLHLNFSSNDKQRKMTFLRLVMFSHPLSVYNSQERNE